MKKYIAQFGWKIFALSVALGLFVGLSWNNKPVLFAAEDTFLTPLINYGEIDDPEELVSEYHKAMNEELNKRVELFLSAKPEELAQMEVVPPKEQKKSIYETAGETLESVEFVRDASKCPLNATSTWCISQKMLGEYYAFRERLTLLRNTLFESAQKKIATNGEQLSFNKVDEVLAEVGKLDAFIDAELSYAQETMELALAAYNELHMAYPLHQKFNEVISALEKYRDAIRDVRDEVELFPYTFFNVQTAQCT